MHSFNRAFMISGTFLLVLVAANAAPAQTFDTLASFDATYGNNLRTMSLAQGPDGNLYGTTFNGGAYGYGSVFKIALTGVLTTLHSFDISDGEYPMSALTLNADGDFYGTTSEGGANGYGTAFKTTPAGVVTTLCSFGSTNAYPVGALVRVADGNFMERRKAVAPATTARFSR